MIIIGIVLALVGLAYLCRLLFALAIYALPFRWRHRRPCHLSHAALGLAHIGISAEGWRHAVAVTGAIVVAATAWARMALSARPVPDRALPPA